MSDGESVLKGIRVSYTGRSNLKDGTIEAAYGPYIIIKFDNDDKLTRKFNYVNSDIIIVSKNETDNNKKLFKQEKIKAARTADLEEYTKLINRLQKEYGFEGFVHYTAFENLKSILKSGYILSRKEMMDNNLEWIDVAETSVLLDTPEEVKNKVRLLYWFNTPISYWFEKRALENQTEMVAIVIDPAIFMTSEMLFYERSAARTNYGAPSSDIEVIKQFEWKEIFERGPMPYNEREKKKKYRDAEVLVEEKLSTEYIRKIYFRSKSFYKKAIEEFGPNEKFKMGIIGDAKHFSSGV